MLSTVICKKCWKVSWMWSCNDCIKSMTPYWLGNIITNSNSIDEKFKQEVLSYLANIYWVTRMTQNRLERKEEEVLATELIEIIDRYRNEYYSNSTIATKIQEKIDKCIKKWRKPFWLDTKLACLESFLMHKHDDGVFIQSWQRYSYHDLFSKDSWLLEQFEWYINADTNIFYSSLKPLWRVKYSDCIYMVMWPMTIEEKIEYFLENATI